MSDFENKLKTFVEGCNAIVLANDESIDFPKELRKTIASSKGGRKYVRIVVVDSSGVAGSVHCFINKENGDVLKAAGWTTPAKGARGNIYDDNNGLARMSPYGAGYNR